VSQPDHEPQHGQHGGPTPPPEQAGYGYDPTSPAAQPNGYAYGQPSAPPYEQPYGQQYGQPGEDHGQQAAGYGQQAYDHGQQPSGYEQQMYGYAQPPTGPDGEPSLDQPHYGISFTGAVKRVFAKYARFDGRASRSEYWWWVLATTLVFGVLGVLIGVLGGATSTGSSSDAPSPVVVVLGILLLLAALAVIVPNIAVTVRRLHDADLSGWLYLLNLIPYVGGLVVLVLTVLPSEPNGARFDRPPTPYGYGS